MGLGGWLHASRALRSLTVALALVAAFSAAARAEEPDGIGTAVVIKPEVVATLGADKRDLHEGGRVHRDDLLETGAEGLAELKLDDQTKLAIGPNASVKLDEFVIAKADGVTTIGVNFVKGTFRFLTGKQKKEAYRIETPSATIGVRGTVFDVYVDGNGDTLVLLHEGEVDICTKTKTCRRHNSTGRIIRATIGGVLSAPIKFTQGLIPGLSAGAAFPFLGRRLVIDPIRRLSAARILDNPATDAARSITKGGRSVGRKLRKALPF